MADESEQNGVGAEQIDVAQVQSTETVADGDTQAGTAAATAGTVESTYDFTTVDGILAASRDNEALRDVLARERTNAENTARQRLEAEMRRDQGSRERAKQFMDNLSSRYQIELAPEDASGLPMFVKANEEYIRTEQAQALLEAAARMAPPEMAEVLRAESAEFVNSPDALTKAADRALNALVAGVRVNAVTALSLDEVPKDSKLLNDIQARIDEGVATELKARARESNKVEVAPKVNGGSPGSISLTSENARAMSAEQAAALPDDQYKQWQALVMASGG